MTKFKFDFVPFYARFEKYYPNKPLPKAHFLQWFLGFVEGDGSLAILGKRFTLGGQTLILTITLHKSDKHVLDYIVANLGLGKVYKSTHNLYCYQLKNSRDASIIIDLFNGNIVIPKFYKRFVLFLEKYNEKVLNLRARPQTKNLGTIELIENNISPTLDDAWFCGFTDAEGCFNASYKASTNKWSYYFAVSQKGKSNLCVLKHLKNVFKCGTIQHAKRGDEWVFKVINLNHSIDIIAPYFQKFGLNTKKNKSFEAWYQVMAALKKKKYRRNSDLDAIYVEIAKNINVPNKK